MSFFQTPLHSHHLQLSAKMTLFHRWDMPLFYRSIKEEHLHTRSFCSLFDTCHMGQFFFRSDHALTALQPFIGRDLSSCQPSRCYYTFFIDKDKKIIDDTIIYVIDDSSLFIVVNAPMRDKIPSFLSSEISSAQLEPLHHYGKIDIQGPLARQTILSQCDFEPLWESVQQLSYFSFRLLSYKDQTLIISRTGYTGELGFEIYAPQSLTLDMWQAALKFEHCQPAGLGARDSLRIEMGYFLSGQDFNSSSTLLDVTPPSLISQLPLHALPSLPHPLHQKVIYFSFKERCLPRTGMPILNSDGQTVGQISSGSFSFSTSCPIGMGMIDSTFSLSSDLFISIRNKMILLHFKKPPFVTSSSLKD